MAQCKLNAVAAGAAEYNEPDLASPSYLVTCMEAAGYALMPKSGYGCSGTAQVKIANADCYYRPIELSN